MSNSPSTITDLSSLDLEIARLSLQAKHMEKQLDERLGYLQDNYSSLVMKSVFPVLQPGGGISGTLLGVVLQNKRIRDSFTKLTEQLLSRVSDGLDFLSDKLEKKG
jgi:hypothetical protein